MKNIPRVLSRAFRQAYRQEAEAAARRFVRLASERGLEVAYALVPSPLGSLIVACTPRGLVRLSYRSDDLDQVLEELAARISPRVLEAPERLDPIRRELDEYFEGRRRSFEVSIDWALARGFVRSVLRRTARIPYGNISSYREVATLAGSPNAVRAAGNALAANPVAIVVPCHRVLRSDGSLGGYGGGIERKEFLLRLEGVDPERPARA